MQRLREYLGKKIFPIVLGLLFATFSLFSFTSPVLAAPEDNAPSETVEVETEPAPESTETTESSAETTPDTPTENTGDQTSCFDQVGEISWLVCPTSGFIANIVDTLYGAVENFLVLKPLTTDAGSPIRIIWEYARNISNIVFVIFLLVIVYSQITGIGISNYGVKRVLPRIIIAALLVNLSFFICSFAIDVSNVLGASIQGLYNHIANTVVANGTLNPAAHFSVANLFTVIAGGGAIAGLSLASPLGASYLLFMLIPALLGILGSVVVGLFTISLRQAVISLLVMVAPLAFVAYLLPNTEKWFKKWKDTFFQMIVFYPMFALLFWAARLAGWALITSANSWLGVILGVVVQIAPLFLAISLMKMSGTVLGTVSNKFSQLGSRATGGLRNWSESMRENRRQNYFARSKMPYARLQRYLDYRSQLRELDTTNARKLRNSLAMQEVYRRRLSAKYDPDNPTRKLKRNSSVRLAKEADVAELKAKTLANNAAHVSNRYGDFFAGKSDQELAETGARRWLDYNRSEFANISDSEDDFDFLVGEYVNAMYAGPDSWQYRRYLTSAAGKRGVSSIMGQLIAKANAVEQRKRRDDSILLAKFGYQKGAQRSMLTGYYVDDNGYATDPQGNRLTDENGHNLEKYPGQLLARDPSKLHLWYQVDENGRPYYDWNDKNGHFLMRIYKDDSAFTKEILSNYDITIGDPINNLYNILAGLSDKDVLLGKDGNPIYVLDQNGNPLLDKKGNPITSAIGLEKYSTTIGRAMLASSYKTNAAYAGPMAAQSVSMSNIKNYAHLNLERLDNIKKTVKPSVFNSQSADEFETIVSLLESDYWWTDAFPPDLLRDRVNVNKDPYYGLDENLKKVPIEQATDEQINRTTKLKYIYPAVSQMALMMEQITPTVQDNQKPAARKAFDRLKKIIEDLREQEKSDPEAIAMRQKEEQKTKDDNTSAENHTGLPSGDQSTNINNSRRHLSGGQILAKVEQAYINHNFGADSDVNGFMKDITDLVNEINDPNFSAALGTLTQSITSATPLREARDQVVEAFSGILASYGD